MLGLLLSILFFAVVVGLITIGQRKKRHEAEAEAYHANAELQQAADIAQRRHTQQYGSASAELQQVLTQPTTKKAVQRTLNGLNGLTSIPGGKP